MSDIQPYGSPTSQMATSSSSSRQGRAISKVVRGAELAVVKTAAAAHIETARLDAIDTVTSRALQGVALVSQMEQQLAQSVPIAASRLQAIGDMHALATASQVASFARRLP